MLPVGDRTTLTTLGRPPRSRRTRARDVQAGTFELTFKAAPHRTDELAFGAVVAITTEHAQIEGLGSDTMSDSPWMPPGSPEPAGTPEPTPDAVAPELSPPADTPLLPPPGGAGSPWSRGADDAPALPTAPPADPFGTAPMVAAAAPAFGQPADAASPVPSGLTGDPIDPTPPATRSRSKVLVGAAVVGVLAVGAAGVFAVRSFTGDSVKGGAATPEELGSALMTAIENEDVLGMVDVLSPGERDVFRQPMIDLVSELTRLEVLAPEADLSKIEGFDIALENEAVTARSTNVVDIVNVDMSADATITVDGAAVPVGDLVTDNMDQSDIDEMRSSTETSEEEFDGSLTAVQLDGRWYFSLFFTAAEAARGDYSDSDMQIPVEGIGAVGADSPDAAVNQLFDSVQGLDLRLLIQSLNPGEAAALQRYAPLFLDDAESALDDVPLEWQITTRDFRVEGDGSTRTVFLDTIAIEGNFDGDDFSVSIDGDCVTAEGGGESFEQCAGDAIADDQVDEFLADAPEVKEFIDALSEAFADVEPIGLELREFEGKWYVSPISTWSEAVLKVLRALDRDEIDRLIDLGTAAVDEGFDDVFGGLSGDEFLDEPFLDDEFIVETTTDFSFDTTFDTTAPVGTDACYSETDPEAASSCFLQYVDSGEIDASAVPVELRFPECNYAARWTGELYSMDDATFVSTVEGVRQCFLDKLAAGELEDYELPSEIVYFDCFEGRNWYNTFDDPDYDTRYYACVDAAATGATVPPSTEPAATEVPATTAAG